MSADYFQRSQEDCKWKTKLNANEKRETLLNIRIGNYIYEENEMKWKNYEEN